MKTIIGYIKDYYYQADKRLLALVTVFTALLVFFNYQYGLDDLIRKRSFAVKLIGWYTVFAAAFTLPYLFTSSFYKTNYTRNPRFLFLLLAAPLVFALKLALDISFPFSTDDAWDKYWNHIAYWPVLAVIIGGILFFLWRLFDKEQPFYGTSTKGLNWKPYWLMLLIMLPLVALASTQADFLAVYPKLRTVERLFEEGQLQWWHKILYELSYGTDFITIELFFRGFLILAFVRWAGKDAILPMACFYCSIHFGKPLGECISSYFGGIIPGIVVYNTRSIFGGLLVHLGIAWLMELGGLLPGF